MNQYLRTAADPPTTGARDSRPARSAWPRASSSASPRPRRPTAWRRRSACIVGLVGAAGAGHRGAGLRPDPVRLDRLPAAEQARARLRHHLHLGDQGLRAEDRLDGRLGHHRRRRAGDGEPGPGRRAVRLPALRRRRHRQQPDQRLGAAGRPDLDGRDDLHLLPRHRDLGRASSGGCSPSRSSCWSIFAVIALVKVYGSRRAGTVDPPGLVVVQPVRHQRTAFSITCSPRASC